MATVSGAVVKRTRANKCAWPVSVSVVILAAAAQSQAQTTARPADTEVWEPVPRVVRPPSTFTVGAEPPADALVLFDGTDLNQWVQVGSGEAAAWPVVDGILASDRHAGSIQTRRRFGSYQLHVEWRIPEGTTGNGQGRGNSGVFLASTGGEVDGYEIQILDSYGNETYVNGMAGSVYKQAAPLVNPSRRQGEWQAYDIIWVAPTFDEQGSVSTPARVTVLFNGVVVQNGFSLKGETVYVGAPSYRSHGNSPIKLQAHPASGPVQFRNIWVRDLPGSGGSFR